MKQGSIFYSEGRLPWYDANTSSPSRPFVIGVAGGTASGKTSVCDRVLEKLGLSWVQIISTDNFYYPLTPEQHENVSAHNFDHPDAFDWDLMVESLCKICNGKFAEIPLYDFCTHARRAESRVISGADVLIVEGILCFWDSRIRDMCDILIFVDADADLRLVRRLRRDISERGRSLDSVLNQYEKTVKPSFDEFVAPTKKYADLIIPRGRENSVAIDLLVEHIRSIMSMRGVEFSEQNYIIRFDEGTGLPHMVKVLDDTPLNRWAHSIIRDRKTSLDDFRYNVDLLSERMGIAALDLLSYEPTQVQTPTGCIFNGLQKISKVCAVSLIRSGEALEAGLKVVFEDISIGKILIQQQGQHHHQPPRFFYSELPPGLSDSVVFVLDAILSTSSAMQMAIRLLLDHGVQESNIVLLVLIAAPEGLLRINRMFPKLRVIVSSLDSGLDEQHFSLPGCGPFGNRFFGTE